VHVVEAVGFRDGGIVKACSAKCSFRVLALVTDAFGGHGGIAQYNRNFLSALAACEGIGQIIVLPRASDTSAGLLPSGVRQLRPVQGKFRYASVAFQVAIQPPIDVIFCGHLFMAPLAAALATLVGARLWVQVHGIETWQSPSDLHRRSIEAATLVTSVSRYTRRSLLKWVGIEPTRVKVLPNTVDACFRPGPKPSYLLEQYAVRERKVLLTVSRLVSAERYKGHDRVIRVLPRVLLDQPDTIYIIVGDGDDRPRLEALAQECGVADKVCFAGRVAPEKLPDYFRLADALLMPSTGEGFGIVFLEAMACGIPVIGGNQDGSLDALADGELGSTVTPDNEQELVSAISTALRTNSANVDGARRFNHGNFTQHLEALVQSHFTSL
jgi:phosphatidylinositol alpha-1,6-mannosyltransferase